MIKSIKICANHQRFIDGKKDIKFEKGLNVVIGPNGSGKSSLLKAIYECPDCLRENSPDTQYYYFDSETMNPHKSEKIFKGDVGSILKVRAMFSSHGETMRDVLSCIPLKAGSCLLLDEPETGHDLSWVMKIRKGMDDLVKNKFQIVAASHHPVFWKKANVIELKKGYLKNTLNKFRKTIEG